MHIEERVTVNRPAAEVFAFLSDFEQRPVYLANVEKARKTSEGPLAEGATFSEESRIAGQLISMTYKVTAYDPPRSIELRTIAGPGSGTSRIAVDGEQVTTVRVAMDGEPGGVFKLAGPFLSRLFQKQLVADLATLKRVLEAEPA